MRFERVVVGVDFLPPSLNAARWVSEWLAPEAEVVLVHALASSRHPRFVRRHHVDAAALALRGREEAEARLREIARGLSGGRVRVEVRAGAAHDALGRAAIEARADLIVVGPHGGSRALLGSTAERLARLAPVPVLVTPELPLRSLRRILVAVDESTMAGDVIRSCNGFAERFDADVVLLHVMSPAVYRQLQYVAAIPARDEDEAHDLVHEELRGEALRWLGDMASAGLQSARVEADVAYGTPGERILEEARKIDATLVILGRHGEGQLFPALLGSTARVVLHGAKCPVLVIGPARDAVAHA